METKLYVYTGTGNSLWVAHRLAEELQDASIEFMSDLAEDLEPVAQRVGFLFPVHIWGLPARVIHFANHLRMKPQTYFFAIAVNAGQPAATLLQLQKLMANRTFSLSSGYSIVLPSNYIPWGGPGPLETQHRLFRDAKDKVKRIAHDILGGERKKVDRGPLWQNIIFSWVYKMSFRQVPKMDKKFWVDHQCNGCDICLKVCPAGNIEMKDKKPSWLHRCEQCLACLQWCPQQAIQYGKKTAMVQRYHHPEVALRNMLDQTGAAKK